MPNRLSQILEERPGEFVSGEAVSRLLGTTRAAVWKQVQALRARGYEIEGARGEGYRLLGRPDVLLAEELSARLPKDTPWRDFEYYAVTDSTNTRAMELAERGASHGTVVCADAQSAGRGRRGRVWVSPPGINLYLTLLLRPPVEAVLAPRLTLVAAVALAQGIEDAAGVECRLKWPNDLFLGGRKAAGILAEMAADPDGVRHVAIGVGVNVNGSAADFPEELRKIATSIRIESGRRFARVDVLAAFLDRFATAYGVFLASGLPPLLPEWERRDLLAGKRVLLRRGAEMIAGVAQGIDGDGALRFLPEGADLPEAVHSGEIIEFGR